MRGKSSGRYSPSRQGSDDDASTRWLGTYGDAVTLLMAFFVMLYAMSQVDVVKFQAFVSGLKGPFDNTSDTESLLPPGGSLVGENGFVDTAPEPAPATDPIAPPSMPSGGGDAVKPDLEQLAEVRAAVEAHLAEAGLEDLAELRVDERGLVVSIASDDVLFATGSTTISPVGLDVIASVAGALETFPNDVLVEGHTDDVPLARVGYTNWNLSTDRAVAVLSVLVERYGFPQTRLGAVGYSEYRPLAPNDTPTDRARNRRVDVVILVEEARDE